jgi:hypothetical protein
MDSEGHVVTRGKRGGDDDENCKANINTPSLTASITIPLSNDAKKEVICHGYSDGQLWIIPTGYVLFRRDCFSRLSAVTVLQLFGHYAAVTSLFLPLFSSIVCLPNIVSSLKSMLK